MLTINHCPSCNIALSEEDGTCPQCGQAYCPECGAQLDEGADSCQKCGIEFASFCSACDQEVPSDALICPHCNAPLITVDELEAQSQTVDLTDELQATAKCPSCDQPVFLEDGFCSSCGVVLCSNCGKIVGEEDENCPHCHQPLYFNCPLCGFELVTGSDQCPNCNALVPNYCTVCRSALPRDAQQCPRCTTPVKVQPRKSARVIHSIRLEELIIQVAACPGCGGKLHVHEGICASCGYRICPSCQISLDEDELICPRCGPDRILLLNEQKPRNCQICGHALAVQDEECSQCGQLFCPVCQEPIDETDLACSKCGTEFDFECPDCGETVSAEDTICPSCGAEI